MLWLGIDIGGTSVKLACVNPSQTVWIARSAMYQRPNKAELIAAVRQALAGHDECYDAVGMCVPGLLDKTTRTVTFSVNVPGLTGQRMDQLVSESLGTNAPSPTLLTDANAAGYDFYTSRKLTGRLMLLVLGTGIGAAVIDEAGPLAVDGDSPGHFGQLDVSIEGEPVVGPDSGAGSLEGYLGVAALRQRYGDDFSQKLPTLPATEPPYRALARAIRIGHAIYRPHHVGLAGGIGNALGPILPALRQLVSDRLTNIARTDWTLFCGDSDYHAALGAAKLAGRDG